jgi:tetratricopeptide (TPR) repeat protein
VPFSKGRAVEAANKAMKRGQYGKAIAEYQRIVKQDPNDIRAKLKLGDLYIRAGETDAAVQVLREVAEHYSQEGFTLKAVAVLKQILKLDPRLADVSVALAAHLHQQGLVNEAVRQYKDAARIYGQHGQSAERLEVIRHMVELDPDNVTDRIRLAESFSASGRYSEAVALFRDGCRILEKRDRPQLYCKVAERLLHHQPDDFQINRQLATYYLKDRDAQRALPKLRACYRQQPRDLDVLDMLQETFDLLGQPHKAVSVLREMARIYEENGLLKERDQTYERILLINSADSEARKALRIVNAVGEQQLVLEFDESGPRVKPDGTPAEDDDDFEEVDLDVDTFELPSKPAAAARLAAARPAPAAGAAGRPVATTTPGRPAAGAAAPAAKAPAAAAATAGAAAKPPAASTPPAAPAARPVHDTIRDGTLDEIFGELDLDEEIDIQEDGEDTIVVGEVALADFDEVNFDDELKKAQDLGRKMSGAAGGADARRAAATAAAVGAARKAPAGAAGGAAVAAAAAENGLQDDWKSLFSDEGPGDHDIEAAFGRTGADGDLQRALAEADRAGAGRVKPATAPTSAAAARPAVGAGAARPAAPPTAAAARPAVGAGAARPAATPAARPAVTPVAAAAAAARPAAAAPKPAAAAAGTTDLALQEALEEVEFYVSNQLTDDAVQLLRELQSEYPGHPEILRRLRSLGKS